MDTESQACDQCYRTKQTCSKSLPRCKRCLDAANPCTYSFGKFMGKPKRSNKIRRQSSNNDLGEMSSGGKFFGLLNLKNEVPEPQRSPPVTDIGSPTQSVWTSSSWDLLPEGLSSENSSTSNPTSPTRVRTQSTTGGNRLMVTPACDQCYRFKVKCSRDPDCCRRCANNRSVCTYSAAAVKPDQKTKTGEENRKKKARISPDDDPSVISMDLRGTSVDSRCYSFTDSPTSQHAELHSEEMNNFYGFEVPSIESSYGFAPQIHESVPPTPGTWAPNPTTLYELDPIGLAPSNEKYPINWPSPDLLHSPYFAQQIALQKFPQPSTPSMGQLPTPTSPAFPHDAMTATCECFSTALSILNGIHSCLQQQSRLETRSQIAQSQRHILQTSTHALEVCEQSTHCNRPHTSVISMLYAVILQQVCSCYDILSSIHLARSGEFPEHGEEQWKSWTMIRNEKLRALACCREMEGRLRNMNFGIEDGDASEAMGRNSVLGLLGSVKGRLGDRICG
ncbi:hypothetical protein BJ875DRAFT_451126 [Amylocarpus encephaloides]|uniref:Zn(2)-C6 fungal-type domain-containing protein n=1 Tax=Amylocarpus encephaloides TaxID=45428 RepID=A0A9P7YSH3_9HELO|nr:hypothetical protein BJ875DRAFT_451126 [Amylocarpus encephaloides]